MNPRKNKILMEWEWQESLATLWRIQGIHIMLFLVVNVGIGSLAVWMPILIGWTQTGNIMEKTVEQFEASGPYTFAIAFLAGCVSLVVTEYLDSNGIERKKLKVFFSLISVVLMIMCTVLSSSQTAKPSDNDAAESATSNIQSNTSLHPLAQEGSTIESTDVMNKSKHKFKRTDMVQFWLVLIAIVIGLAVFLAFQFQTDPMKEELAKIELQTSNDADNLLSEAEEYFKVEADADDLLSEANADIENKGA